jgi:hypothetical protein
MKNGLRRSAARACSTTTGTKIDVDVGFADGPQPQAHKFAHQMPLTTDQVGIHPLADGNIADRIEVIHGQVELFFKKLQGVGQICPAAGEQDRRGALPPCWLR